MSWLSIWLASLHAPSHPARVLQQGYTEQFGVEELGVNEMEQEVGSPAQEGREGLGGEAFFVFIAQ
jgi:hypothetical protein